MTPPANPESQPPEKEKRPSSGRGKPKPAARGSGNGVLAALREGLVEALPGLEILDRNLAFDERGRADLAAVDATGRLVLVLVVGGDDEKAIPETLDALAFARRNADLLARHLEGRVDPGLQPRIVVVDPGNGTVILERLAQLAPLGVEVFGVRTIRSEQGERSYLVARDVPSSARGPAELGAEAFLEALPEPLRDLGRGLTDRMARLDEDLIATGDRNALVWRFDGEVLARVDRVGPDLRASVGLDRQSGPLREAADVDRLVEGALARLVERMEGGVADLDEPAAGGGRPQSDEPLLTAEEIEAFRA